MTTAYESRVINAICEHSNSPIHAQAKNEWDFQGLSYSNGSNHCEACGKQHIRRLFTIKNRLNGNQMILGSECIMNYVSIDGRDHDQMVEWVLNLLADQAEKARKAEFSKRFPWVINALQSISHKDATNPKVVTIAKYFNVHGYISNKQRVRLMNILYTLSPEDLASQVVPEMYEYRVTQGEREQLVIEYLEVHHDVDALEAALAERGRERSTLLSVSEQNAMTMAVTSTWSEERKVRFMDLLFLSKDRSLTQKEEYLVQKMLTALRKMETQNVAS